MRRTLGAAFVAGLAWIAAPAMAQQEGHQMPARPASSDQSAELVAACVAAQRHVSSLADAVNLRLEDARQSNSPQQMRATLADVQAALVEIRTRAAACSPLQAASEAADPHAGHAMPSAPVPPTATKPSAAAAPAPKPAKPVDPHAGHTMPSPAKPGQPPSKPAPESKEAKDTVDPVCGDTVDPGKAPRATYEGKTYYFCSAKDRLKFIRNPETYLKKKESAK
jgi:YHS domain-containing protein